MRNKLVLIGIALVMLVSLFPVFVYGAGFENKDEAFCSRLYVNEGKYECYQDISRGKSNPKELCKGLSEGRANICYEQVARATLEHTICDNLYIEDYLKDTASAIQACKLNVAVLKGDGSICDGLSSLFWIEDCYSKTGPATEDPELCEKISQDNYKRDGCFLRIATSTKYNILCDKISEDSLRLHCYSNTISSRSLTTNFAWIKLLVMIIFLSILLLLIILFKSHIIRDSKLLFITLIAIIISLGITIISSGLLSASMDDFLNQIPVLTMLFLKYAFYGFLISLAIAKRKNYVLVGGIIGFFTSLLVYSTIPISGLLILPLMPLIYLATLISDLGEGNIIYLAILNPIFYISIGILIGWIIFKRRRER